MESLVGQTIGKYQIIEELGKGGTAVVYRGLDVDLARNVAIKVMLPNRQESVKSLRRFTLEARKLAQMSHPNIVMVWDYGEYNNVPYLVMEYIPGGTLQEQMNRVYSVKEAANLLIPVGNALHYAHQKARIVHRDIKPSNILFNDSGQPLITDFGIAKLIDAEESQGITGTGVLIGTPTYMSPEQIQGKTIDARSDVYSLGVMFFEMVTGHKPYTANTPIEVSLKHVNDPIPRPRQYQKDISPDAEVVIMKAMAKKPEDRYADMAAFVSAMEDLLSGKKQRGKPGKTATSSEEPSEQPTKKKQMPVWLIVVPVLLVALGVAGFLLRSNGQASTAPTSLPVAETTLPTDLPGTPQPVPTATIAPQLTPTVQITAVAPTATPVESPTAVPKTVDALDASITDLIIELGRIEKISVIDLDWTQDGKWIVNAGSNSLSLIDPITMKSSDSLTLSNAIPSKMFVSDDSSLIGLLINNQIRLYGVDPFEYKKTITLSTSASNIAIAHGNKLLAASMFDNRVLLIDIETGSVVSNLRSNYGGWGVAFSPDGEWVASGTSQGALLWESQTGIWHPISTGQSDLIKTVVFSNDGRIVAGGAKGKIYLWDVETGNQIMMLEGFFDTVNSLRFSPDDSLLLAATKDGLVQVWDPNTAELLAELKNHKSEVFKAVFSPGGDLIASGANEGIIRLWGIP